MKNGNFQVGVIGVGARGSFLVSGILCRNPDVTIRYICDRYADRAEASAKEVQQLTGTLPAVVTDYQTILNDPEIEVVFNYASWETHLPIAIACMKVGKICGFEVGGAYSLQQCWDLVHTYEETGVPCMMLENCCYDKRETMIMNMVRKGLFGEVIHCEGGYRHDLRDEVAFGVEKRHYRLAQYKARNCDNYPTHDLGPIAKILEINRGNRMVSLVSVASKAAGLRDYIERHKAEDDVLRQTTFAQGDVVDTLIRCANGETIRLTLDTTLPRFYSRDFCVQGTRAMYTEQGDALFLDGVGDHNLPITDHLRSAEQYEETYLSPTWKTYRHNPVGGHGGMDWLVHTAFLDCLRRGETEMPIDVYDIAAWTCISALSEISIAKGGQPVDIPDFTNGAWITRKPYDVEDFSGD